MSVDRTAEAFRRWGYLQADLDPLHRLRPCPHPALSDVPPEEAAPWLPIYCGPIGVEFMHLRYPDRCRWVVDRMENPGEEANPLTRMRRVAAAELFERFLHARYVGTKRYSLEGSAALIPLLDAVLEAAGAQGAEIVLIAMSHRGRLNVMAHVVGTPVEKILAGFEDVDPRSVLGSGDVKYHLGATGRYVSPSGHSLEVHLVSNPSHLEAVDPVMMGRARARQQRIGPNGPAKVLPIALHGDAAFAGQGIVAETLNLADLDGFTVGGTIHVVVNNLIGFTATPAALHSSRYASDAARRLDVPIFHVNGERPGAVARAGRMALDYRAAFGSDVVVDLIGYRRYGHSEVDDPTITQPVLYREIERRPMLWQLEADRLGLVPEERHRLEAEVSGALDTALAAARAMTVAPSIRDLPPYWSAFRGGPWDPAFEVHTAVAGERLAEIGRRMTALPEGFVVHPKAGRVLEDRMAMSLGEKPVDWGAAEALAFGSLLRDGIPVRLAGQDSRRGTFGHRHAVLFDHRTGTECVPLAALASPPAFFEVRDTSLSEAGALGFEYGFSRDYPEALVCWEAQFGDFANGAQTIIDQFLSAGEDKWGLLSGIVVLLPHGYEGQGPEHSSARPERFLQLAAEDNLQICQPSTAAQYFHLLRRQVLRAWRKPLVVLMPKSLLRAAVAASDRTDLIQGKFRTVLPDRGVPAAERVLVCSGKLAHELRAHRARRGDDSTAIISLEQIYPFPEPELSAALAALGEAREVLWIQEEPANMGPLAFVLPRLERCVSGRRVGSVKRTASASPATGSAKAHAIEQKTLLELAFARSK